MSCYFLFFLLFRHRLDIYTISSLLILNIVGIYDTVYRSDYYNTYHFANFKGIAHDFSEWNTKFNNDNITYTININHPYYINYYLCRLNNNIDLNNILIQEVRIWLN